MQLCWAIAVQARSSARGARHQQPGLPNEHVHQVAAGAKARTQAKFAGIRATSERPKPGQALLFPLRFLSNGAMHLLASGRLRSQSVDGRWASGALERSEPQKHQPHPAIGEPPNEIGWRYARHQQRRTRACSWSPTRSALTLPSRGRPQAGFAHLRPPLMSNVRCRNYVPRCGQPIHFALDLLPYPL